REVRGDFLRRDQLVEVQQVRTDEPGPDHVDHVDVDVGAAGCQLLLVEREAVAGLVGDLDDVDRVPGPGGPGIGSRLADIVALAGRVAGEGEGDSRSSGGSRKQSEYSQRNGRLHVLLQEATNE